MDLVTIIVPLLVALVAGGGVAFYTARPHKDSIIAAASKNAVDVVNLAIERLEDENKTLLERLRDVEAELARVEAELTSARQAAEQCLARTRMLEASIIALGGSVT